MSGAERWDRRVGQRVRRGAKTSKETSAEELIYIYRALTPPGSRNVRFGCGALLAQLGKLVLNDRVVHDVEVAAGIHDLLKAKWQYERQRSSDRYSRGARPSDFGREQDICSKSQRRFAAVRCRSRSWPHAWRTSARMQRQVLW